MPARRNLAAAAFAAALAGLAAAPAAADCAAIDARVRAALSASDTASYPALYNEVLADPSCAPAYKDQTGRIFARSTLTTFSTAADPAQIEAATTKFGRPWQVLVPLGDIYYERQDWTNAVKFYEEALDDMRNVEANPKAPPEDVERRAYKRAVEARALSPTFIATRSFRGKKSGLASPNFRNFTAVAVPVPIQFETGSADLTPQGIIAVTDVYTYLSESAPHHVVITGHTDPRGSDAYNLDLSLRRAYTVRDYLVQLGYRGTIEAYGKGEHEPFSPDDPSKYTIEQQWAFDRRVEYFTP